MLINSPTSITNRFYLLYTPDRTSYQRIVYSEKLFGKPTFQKTEEVVSLAEMDALLANPQIVEPFVAQFLPVEALFWNEATEEMKRAALYSYVYHQLHKNKKIPNMEVANWTTLPFFKNHLAATYKNAHVTNLKHPRTMLNAIFSLVGKHQVGFRMGHFHIVKDTIAGTDIYNVHWDYGLAVVSWSIFHHWLYDDMPS